jgi:hypothetical protein
VAADVPSTIPASGFVAVQGVRLLATATGLARSRTKNAALLGPFGYPFSEDFFLRGTF